MRDGPEPLDEPPANVDVVTVGDPVGSDVDTSPSDPWSREVDPSDHADPEAPPAGEAAPDTVASRVMRRVLRRPRAWAAAEWTSDRVVAVVTTTSALVITTLVMMSAVHFFPFWPSRDLVFDDTTPTGGDFGAHVWGPAFLRDHLLPSFRLNGWSMDWYAGLPAYRFYMVLPALAIVALDVVFPYGVAMKIVGVAGLVTLPAACWAFGRLARFRYPMPELFAFAGVAFALDESFSIYGGNLKSTMAGEFSFSIALSIGMVGLGVLAAGMRTGRYRVWASVLIAASAVSHGIVAIFILLSAFVIVMVWIDRPRRFYAFSVGLTAFLLSIWWVGPFLLNHAFMTDMKYGFRPQGADDSFWAMFFPLTAPLDMIISTFAVIGFAACVWRRHLTGVALGVIGLALVALVYLTRDSLPVIGLLWNPRLLPFLYLVRYLLMMVGIVEVMTVAWNAIRDRRAMEVVGVVPSTVFAAVTAAVVLAILGWMFQVLPGGGQQVAVEGQAPVYSWGPLRATSTNARAQGDGWARYNFAGYEGRGEWYTEYHDVVTTMERIGRDQGCGRALWENNSDNGRYGTTMALMLLPHWTDGCIGSMEGLFFEASGTTPYHFLTTAAMSERSSNPVRELRYVDNDASVGVPHLQALGVRYVMVRTDAAKAEAAVHADLAFIASSGPWDVFEVADSDVVVPLTVQPVVVASRPGDQRERHLELGTSWFQNPDEWAAIPADDGPDEWQRIEAEVDLERRQGEPGAPGRRVDVVVPSETIRPVPLPEVVVSDVVIDQQSLSFSVDRIGVPILVRVSYFPNWDASGADGPYRVAPNMMVVVPTSNQVELTFGRSATDWVFTGLTVVGIGLCVYWRRRGDEDVSAVAAAPAVDDPDGPVDGDAAADDPDGPVDADGPIVASAPAPVAAEPLDDPGAGPVREQAPT